MRSDEYRRLHLACLDMAKQSSVPDAQMRWLAMAMSCFNLAIEPAERSLDGAEVKTALAEKERVLIQRAQERFRQVFEELADLSAPQAAKKLNECGIRTVLRDQCHATQ